MEQNPFSKLGMDPMISSWMKLTNSSLGDIGKQWQKYNGTTNNGPFFNKTSSANDSMESLLKTWRMVSSTFSHSESVSENFSEMGELPAGLMKFAQSQVEGFSRVQQQMIDKIKGTTK